MTLEQALEKLKWYEQPEITKAIMKGLCIEDSEMPTEIWKLLSLPFTDTTVGK